MSFGFGPSRTSFSSKGTLFTPSHDSSDEVNPQSDSPNNLLQSLTLETDSNLGAGCRVDLRTPRSTNQRLPIEYYSHDNAQHSGSAMDSTSRGPLADPSDSDPTIGAQTPSAPVSVGISRTATEASLSLTNGDPAEDLEDELPEAPIYNQQMQQSLGDVKRHLLSLANTLRLSEMARDPSTNLYQLERETRELGSFEPPEKRTVGFIGDSGVGKSSVINSLLDEPNLARSSRDGAACTCVVTEFRNIDEEHPQPFTIEADFMGEEEIHELLQELLRSFRLFHCLSLFRDVSSTSEQNQVREASGRAQETLQCLFGAYDEFDLDFLSNEATGADEAILAQLKQWAWAEISRRPGGATSLQYSIVADDLQDCKDKLDRLTSNESIEDFPVLWPFTKVLRVYLDSAILKTGLVIADLPGFRDLNYARVRSTERYLLHHCDEVFIVVGISRCTTDASIEDIKARCRGKIQRIVCTRSEDFDPNESARGNSQFHQRVNQINNDYDKVAQERSGLNSSFRKSSSRRRSNFAVKLMELENQLSTLALERTEILVNERNNRISTELSSKHAGVTVFCVSNTLYSDHKGKHEDDSRAYVNLSGVKYLRKHCLLVPAEAQMNAATVFLQHQVPALLGSLRQWALSGQDTVESESADALRALLEDMEQNIRRDLMSSTSFVFRLEEQLRDFYNETILDKIRDSKRRWTRSCIEVSGEWATWSHGSYSAFCRKNGTHSTGVIGYRSWNDELICGTRQELGDRWIAIENFLERQRDGISRTISEIFQQWRNKLHERENDAPNSLENLIMSLRARESCLIHELHSAIENVCQYIEILTRDMLYGHDSSFIGGLMRPAYISCNRESGRGSDARRKGNMDDHLRHSRLFSNYHNLARISYSQGMVGQFENLTQSVTAQVESIIRDLHAVVVPTSGLSEAGRAPALAGELNLGIDYMQQTLQATQSLLQDFIA